MVAKSSVSDTAEVTPAASAAPKSCAMRSSVSSTDARPVSTSAAPVHVRIEETRDQIPSMKVFDGCPFRQWHARIVQRHIRDAVLADRDTGLDDAPAQTTVEHVAPRSTRTCPAAAPGSMRRAPGSSPIRNEGAANAATPSIDVNAVAIGARDLRESGPSLPTERASSSRRCRPRRRRGARPATLRWTSNLRRAR